MAGVQKTEPIVTILAAVDFSSDGANVAPQAVMLARQFGASLELVHVLQSIADGDEYRRRWPLAMQDLERLLVEQVLNGVPATSCVLEGVAGASLVDEVKDHNADLIVMGFHRERPLSGVTLGSCMRHVIAHTDRDVLLTLRGARDGYRSALIAWDGEKPLGPLLARCRYYAPKARLSIYQMVDRQLDVQPATQRTVEALEKLDADQMIKSVIVSSDPLGPALSEAASATKADLLVMPTRGGRHGDIGYTAEKIIAERACDTLCCQASCRG